ncbi:cation diffusion facilitator family transporter [Microbacterium dextranolyticum]|uniref:Cation diffusion facilitator transporter n=1 Tax=Microbacterium dextranolyticum TaxID=36806 RepID=A0A9W6HNW4_9MICO|nr:cation diffusion facilitator family transporter [Microbacterium dextranolyticum]MBM7462682.1 cation diffusion facilitator family transporter [Microbacterium dextranolyticum]GLJ96214.1 cation diffusion facilitator transporter [Microbacterium dextranolyticum]
MTSVRRRSAGTPPAGSESLVTVLVALGANLVIAVAKTVAAMLTGAASMVAEAAHSWADTGNEVFLLIAARRSVHPIDARHPGGYGRAAYVWSLFAAFGLFVVGAGVSITHGVQELLHPEPAGLFGVSYAVLAIAFVLEGTSFLQATRQSRREAVASHRDLLDHVMSTSDPTVRAVFFEDAAALIGLVIAFTGILLHQLTGSSTPDAVGSILVGLLLAVVAVVLIRQNVRFLVGMTVDPDVRRAAVERLLAYSAVAQVTYLHLEYVGPRRVFLVAAVDLAGDMAEHEVAAELNRIEDELQSGPRVAWAVLTLSRPGAPALDPRDPADPLRG